jgi:polar amino acid transport system substrate-binding protein
MNTKKNPGKVVFSFASAAAIAAILLLCSIAAFGQAVPNSSLNAAESEADMLFKLLQFQADVQGSLNDLDLDVANASENLSTKGLEGTAAREVLIKLSETNSNLVETSILGKDGRIITAEGKGSESAEGADISRQEHIAWLLQTKTPVLSKQFLLVQGYSGTALAYPIFSPQGEFLGGITAIIEPDKLLNELVAPLLDGDMHNRSGIADYTFWVMDRDGLLLYDEDTSQIGKNLFKDPLYKPFPDLLELVERRIVAERSGHGNYSYFDVTGDNKTAVNKECYWTTAGLHGEEWRLVITKVVA